MTEPNTDYVRPIDTANGGLGYCHNPPKDERGVLVEALPLALLSTLVIGPASKEWGSHTGDDCPHGMWGKNFDPTNEIPWCDDGDGCRILAYAEDMRRGDEFPPLVLIHRNGEWLIDDGWHRLAAWVRTGATHAPAQCFSDDGPDDPAIHAQIDSSGDAE